MFMHTNEDSPPDGCFHPLFECSLMIFPGAQPLMIRCAPTIIFSCTCSPIHRTLLCFIILARKNTLNLLLFLQSSFGFTRTAYLFSIETLLFPAQKNLLLLCTQSIGFLSQQFISTFFK